MVASSLALTLRSYVFRNSALKRDASLTWVPSDSLRADQVMMGPVISVRLTAYGYAVNSTFKV